MWFLAVPIALVAGAAMGWINNVAGGAGVFALWALQYAWDLPIEVANPTARVAAVAIGLFSFLGYLRHGHRPPPRSWGHAVFSIPGAVLGSRLALALPQVVFRAYLAAVVLLLLRQQLRPAPARAAREPPAWQPALGCLLIGLHMGYAQIGAGLLTALLLAGAYRHDLVAVNAAKSVVVILTAVSSVVTFGAAHMIQWLPGCCVAGGAACGSYVASRWSVRKGSSAVRRVVIAIALLTLIEQLVHLAIAIGSASAAR